MRAVGYLHIVSRRSDDIIAGGRLRDALGVNDLLLLNIFVSVEHDKFSIRYKLNEAGKHESSDIDRIANISIRMYYLHWRYGASSRI